MIGLSGETEQKKRDAERWIADAVKEPRDWDKITRLLALVEGESREHGDNPSQEQWAFVLDVREKVRTALLSLLVPQEPAS